MGRLFNTEDRRRIHATLLAQQGDACYYCGITIRSATLLAAEGMTILLASGPLMRYLDSSGVERAAALATIDHRKPIARKGKKHRLGNLVMACFPCNQAKRTRTDVEYLYLLEQQPCDPSSSSPSPSSSSALSSPGATTGATAS